MCVIIIVEGMLELDVQGGQGEFIILELLLVVNWLLLVCVCWLIDDVVFGLYKICFVIYVDSGSDSFVLCELLSFIVLC